jgi:hypothetical protein
LNNRNAAECEALGANISALQTRLKDWAAHQARTGGHNRAKARGQADAINRSVPRFKETALDQPF